MSPVQLAVLAVGLTLAVSGVAAVAAAGTARAANAARRVVVRSLIVQVRTPCAALTCPVASSAGGLEAQPLAGAQLPGGLRRDLAAVDEVAPDRAVGSAVGPGGRGPAALGKQREGHVLQRLALAHDAVAAAEAPGAAAAAAQLVARHAQREGLLERL